MYFYCVIVVCLLSVIAADYWTQREEFLQDEQSKVIGASITLNNNENLVNNYLMTLKLNEFKEGVEDPEHFIPARHVFDVLEDIQNSTVFQFMEKLPKGALLHGHDLGLASGEYLYNLTYSDDLYVCEYDDTIMLKFLKAPETDVYCIWEAIEVLRGRDKKFDDRLKAKLTMFRSDYQSVYTNTNIAWEYFQNIFTTIEPLVSYKPIFIKYFYQTLLELYDDNVFYLEFRTTLPNVYDLDGNIYGPFEVAALYNEVNENFIADHPDFLGAKLIYAPTRKIDDVTMQSYIDITKGLISNFPNFVAGFDLVGQEDGGRPLQDFIEELTTIKEFTDLFFHAGETNWFGTTTDENLIDAVLLGTVRIGHGYAALKHQGVLESIKNNSIAIEVCPISNQVLRLVDDMRNHPANYYIANDFPVVISSDDPGLWGAKGLSYDWYIAFVGMSSRHTDLRFLKQLALNSINYSVYNNKTAALNLWKTKWDQFINSYVTEINKDRRIY